MFNTEKSVNLGGDIQAAGDGSSLVKIGQSVKKQVIQGGAIASMGTTQNSTPTAAQLLGGIVTQTSATGGGTVTLPTGTVMSTAVTGVQVGDSFRVRFAWWWSDFNHNRNNRHDSRRNRNRGFWNKH